MHDEIKRHSVIDKAAASFFTFLIDPGSKPHNGMFVCLIVFILGLFLEINIVSKISIGAVAKGSDLNTS